MKKRWVINFLITYIVLYNLTFSNLRKENINKKSLRNQIVYLVNETSPFTGELIGEGIKEQYENGIKNGFFQGFVQDKNERFVYEGKYINGIKHGVWTLKYLNGDTKGILKYNYDKPNGQWTYFYENKNMEGYENLEDGILHGKVVKYSPVGELLTKVEYYNGLLEGEAVFFYKGEILETLTNFKYGKIDGGIIIYDKAGLVAQKSRFIQGNEVDSNGSVLKKDKELKDSIVDRFKKFNRSLKYEKYDKILSEME